MSLYCIMVFCKLTSIFNLLNINEKKDVTHQSFTLIFLRFLRGASRFQSYKNKIVVMSLNDNSAEEDRDCFSNPNSHLGIFLKNMLAWQRGNLGELTTKDYKPSTHPSKLQQGASQALFCVDRHQDMQHFLCNLFRLRQHTEAMCIACLQRDHFAFLHCRLLFKFTARI